MLTPRRPLLIGLLALLLLLPSCFDVPLGDPATAKVDRRLVGYWEQVTDGSSGTVVAIAAYDEHTYLLAFHNYRRAGEAITPAGGSFHKAWLTDVGQSPFLTIQPMTQLPGLDDDEKPWFVLARLSIEDKQVTAHGLKPDSPLIKAAQDPAALAKVIAAHLDDPAIYVEQPTTYRKLDRANPQDGRLIDISIGNTGG